MSLGMNSDLWIVHDETDAEALADGTFLVPPQCVPVDVHNRQILATCAMKVGSRLDIYGLMQTASNERLLHVYKLRPASPVRLIHVGRADLEDNWRLQMKAQGAHITVDVSRRGGMTIGEVVADVADRKASCKIIPVANEWPDAQLSYLRTGVEHLLELSDLIHESFAMVSI